MEKQTSARAGNQAIVVTEKHNLVELSSPGEEGDSYWWVQVMMQGALSAVWVGSKFGMWGKEVWQKPLHSVDQPNRNRVRGHWGSPGFLRCSQHLRQQSQVQRWSLEVEAPMTSSERLLASKAQIPCSELRGKAELAYVEKGSLELSK